MVTNKEAKALADQIRTINKLRLGSYIGRLTKSEMTEIEKAIKLTLSLN